MTLISKAKRIARCDRRDTLFLFYPTSFYQKPQVVDCESFIQTRRYSRDLLLRIFWRRFSNERKKTPLFDCHLRSFSRTREKERERKSNVFFTRLNYHEIISLRLCFIIDAIVRDPSGFKSISFKIFRIHLELPPRLLNDTSRRRASLIFITQNLVVCVNLKRNR